MKGVKDWIGGLVVGGAVALSGCSPSTLVEAIITAAAPISGDDILYASLRHGPCRLNCGDDILYNGLANRLGSGYTLGMEDDFYLEDCGFEDARGFGRWSTLDYVGCDGGLRLVWAWDSLYYVRASEGWGGKLKNALVDSSGVGIGDSLEAFLNKFPGAEVIDPKREDYFYLIGETSDPGEEVSAYSVGSDLAVTTEDGRVRSIFFGSPGMFEDIVETRR